MKNIRQGTRWSSTEGRHESGDTEALPLPQTAPRRNQDSPLCESHAVLLGYHSMGPARAKRSGSSGRYRAGHRSVGLGVSTVEVRAVCTATLSPRPLQQLSASVPAPPFLNNGQSLRTRLLGRGASIRCHGSGEGGHPEGCYKLEWRLQTPGRVPPGHSAPVRMLCPIRNARYCLEPVLVSCRVLQDSCQHWRNEQRGVYTSNWGRGGACLGAGDASRWWTGIPCHPRSHLRPLPCSLRWFREDTRGGADRLHAPGWPMRAGRRPRPPPVSSSHQNHCRGPPPCAGHPSP